MTGEDAAELSVSDPPRADLLLFLTPGELSESDPDLLPRSGLTPDNTDFNPATAAFSLPAGVLLRGVLTLSAGLLLRLASLGCGAARLREGESTLLVEVALPLLSLAALAALVLEALALAVGLNALADFVAAVLVDFWWVGS